MNNFSDFPTETINNVFIININFTRATLKEAELFNKMLNNAMKEGKNQIIIDMHQVEFIDSTFLGVLVVNLKKSILTSGRIMLVGLSPSVNTVVLHANLSRTFEIFSSREDALKHI